MRLKIAAVGRLRRGPEAALVDDYLSRFDKTGRAHGLGPVTLQEVEARKSGKPAEATLLIKATVGIKPVIVLDERGRMLSSPQFAKQLATWRDQGCPEAAFVIGGADGLDRSIRDQADFAISFGAMVWPHMLARVMLAEQLYRAASILAGSPYHRV
ncbi:MAG: 23S rRNA (pseudouridine(1915)-N(3))-methyltransferase RlmH [Silicimonas sp.]|nr:23S rRNA (pseudouridine(1915)-N(3))-methyltransferase RlmH [Silicimonas sp.]